jgi:predicted DNA-binding protein
MSSRLLTIEGVYDGKSIQPLEPVQTDKKHRVLIIFDGLEDSPHEKEKESFFIPEELLQQLQMLAEKAGRDDWKSFLVDILKEKIQAARDKEFVYEVTDKIRAGLTKAGISEEEILEDFNQFRRNLTRE